MRGVFLCVLLATVGASHIFVTMLSDDTYLPGALTLMESTALHEEAEDIPFYVLCVRGTLSNKTMGVLRNYAASRPVQLVDVDPVIMEPTTCGKKISGPARFANTFSKVQIFDPRHYPFNTSRAVYMDADMMVVGPCITELFSARRYATPAFAPDLVPPDSFNTGLILFEPDAKLHAELLKFAETDVEGCTQLASSYDGGDQGLLNAFFDHEWTGLDGHHEGWSAKHRLSSKYDAMMQMGMVNPAVWAYIEDELCAVHFAGTALKPFIAPESKAALKAAKSSPVLMRYHMMWHLVYARINVQGKPRVDFLQ